MPFCCCPKPGNSRLCHGKFPRYTAENWAIAYKISPQIEDLGIIVRINSELEARAKFPPIGKDQLLFEWAQPYTNRFTPKGQYPTYHLDKTVDTVVKLGFEVFFSSDATSVY